jgi:hypothetical protein
MKRMQVRWATPMLIAALAYGSAGALTGCGDEGAATPAATPSAPMYMGQYTPRTSVEAERATVATVATLRTLAGTYTWDAIATMAAPGTPVAQMLVDADRVSLGAMAQGEYSLDRMFREGLAQGRTAANDEARAVAKQPVEKSLLVALGLSTQAALRGAAAEARAGRWAEASAHWDRAAAWFQGLESNATTRSSTAANGAWGAGVATLSRENMAARIVETLVRGRMAVDARSQRTVVETAAGLEVYLTKYFLLSVVNYGYEVPVAVAATRPTDKLMWEGRAFVEGVVLPFFGASADAPVAALRARWRGPAAMVDRATTVRELAAVYAALVARWSSEAASADELDRLAAVARISATLDVLAEALTHAGNDMAALRARAVMARDAATGAATTPHLDAIREPIAALGRAPQ